MPYRLRQEKGAKALWYASQILGTAGRWAPPLRMNPLAIEGATCRLDECECARLQKRNVRLSLHPLSSTDAYQRLKF